MLKVIYKFKAISIKNANSIFYRTRTNNYISLYGNTEDPELPK